MFLKWFSQVQVTYRISKVVLNSYLANESMGCHSVLEPNEIPTAMRASGGNCGAFNFWKCSKSNGRGRALNIVGKKKRVAWEWNASHDSKTKIINQILEMNKATEIKTRNILKWISASSWRCPLYKLAPLGLLFTHHLWSSLHYLCIIATLILVCND